MVLVCDWKVFEWQSSSTLRSLTRTVGLLTLGPNPLQCVEGLDRQAWVQFQSMAFALLFEMPQVSQLGTK